jgi:hypothetical protein
VRFEAEEGLSVGSFRDIGSIRGETGRGEDLIEKASEVAQNRELPRETG